MKDRNVQHASRFRLTKVPGTDDVYDLIPAPGEVYEEGTLINKSALLKDATAALFGLDDNAVPDDVLAVLSRFHAGLGNEYVWAKSGMRLVPKKGSTNTNKPVIAPKSASEIVNVQYSDSVEVVDGVVKLVNPSVLNLSYNNYTDVTILVGKYYIPDSAATAAFEYDNGVYYCESGTADRGTYNGYYYVQTLSGTNYKMITEEVFDLVGYVNSPDPNAYPPAEDDGFTYNFLGQLGNKVQIETGSYVGTEQSGVNNQNVLTFGFKPILIVISGIDGTGVGSFGFYMWDSEKLKVIYSTSVETCTATVEGNTLSWYASSYLQQLNAYNSTYKYIAIG